MTAEFLHVETDVTCNTCVFITILHKTYRIVFDWIWRVPRSPKQQIFYVYRKNKKMFRCVQYIYIVEFFRSGDRLFSLISAFFSFFLIEWRFFDDFDLAK